MIANLKSIANEYIMGRNQFRKNILSNILKFLLLKITGLTTDPLIL